MQEAIVNIKNDIQRQFKLKEYVLERYHIFHEKQSPTYARYILSMEWFPKNTQEQLDSEADNLNPDGTIIIDIDFNTKTLQRIVFVGGITNKDAKDMFPTCQKASVIDWIEETTGLIFGKQFKIKRDSKNGFIFTAAIDHIKVIPPGTINVEFNEDGELIVFSIDGVFPTDDKVIWEPFSLLPEKMQDTFKKQLKLIDAPIEDSEELLPIYMIEEVYVRNNSEDIRFYNSLNKVILDKTLEWSTPLHGSFQPKEDIDLMTEVTVEDAINNIPHPDNIPLSEKEIQTSINQARDVLRRDYPEDSGKWLLHTIYRDNRYIICEVRLIEGKSSLLPRKLTMMINRQSLEVVNYIDNGEMLAEIFASYKEVNDVSVTEDEAFEKLKNNLSITPTYIYHPEDDSYYLYGELDCSYGVIATNGRTVHLDNL